ncbi:hypothetical protein [Consotaella aegiceratis]|uniref:hypothetical protein n=1 Tax=Consotaella aegiceratis TaxID=3097961 RepID=UPI002F3F1E04
MSRYDDEEKRRREAQAILERVRQETEPQVGAGAQGMWSGMRRHFMAADVDQADRLEVTGTRIGRILGLAAFVLLAVLLFVQLAHSHIR